ncbi:DNA polymerase III subunit gamma/tau [Fulvivirga maritima]|uniref:DNA polymerase III subunit gamma/tau n=1 Tax=Fulvivirga maritima TaxID=2904247 RepID=UPI001F439DCD|nr:DNA polymerase III subunit gamma/tau [Fulvivirga maritima]UII29052.1 DNA polymerase III subunit gamma/tau [Fulvivirga maritima]
MDKFVVSARKYRPTGFEEVVGQSHITTTLKNAIDNNKLAQALLFCGPRGVGKTTCARILARMINQFDEKSEGNSLNIFELDAASNNSVDDIRNLIDQVRYPPQYGKYKVYIIDEVHMLSNAAFNAFLKTLEEPPEYAIFILATTEKHKVIPTILSRCQIFDFNRIQVSDIADHLKGIADREDIKAEEEALHLIAQKADGALRDALSIFDLIVTFSADRNVTYQSTINNLHILDYEYYFKVVDHLLNEDITQSLLIFDEILKQGFDGHNFIVGLSEHLRNLMVSKDNATVHLMEVPANTKEKYIDQANRASKSFLLTALNISNQCDINYKGSKNQRLSVELMLMKLAHINSAISLASENGLKKKSELNEAEEKETTPDSNENAQASTEAPAATTGSGATPTSALKPSKRLSMSKLKTTAKIPKNLDDLAKKTEEEKGNEEKHHVEETFGTDSFTPEQLIQVWNDFAESRKAEGKNSEHMVMKQEFYLKDPTTIVIKFLNPVKIDILDRFRPELLKHLKRKLNNGKISLETELIEAQAQRMIYTNHEKFAYLIEKKPILRDLQNRLGLDTDF